MTAQPVEYGLTVRFGDRFRQPTADYRCRCGYEDAAEGPAAVAAFANTAHRIHNAQCPLQQPGDTK